MPLERNGHDVEAGVVEVGDAVGQTDYYMAGCGRQRGDGWGDGEAAGAGGAGFGWGMV